MKINPQSNYTNSKNQLNFKGRIENEALTNATIKCNKIIHENLENGYDEVLKGTYTEHFSNLGKTVDQFIQNSNGSEIEADYVVAKKIGSYIHRIHSFLSETIEKIAPEDWAQTLKQMKNNTSENEDKITKFIDTCEKKHPELIVENSPKVYSSPKANAGKIIPENAKTVKLSEITSFEDIINNQRKSFISYINNNLIHSEYYKNIQTAASNVSNGLYEEVSSPAGFSTFLVNNGKPSEAENYLSKHLETLAKEVKLTSINTETTKGLRETFDALGDVYAIQGKTEAAEQSYKNVIKANGVLDEPLDLKPLDKQIESLKNADAMYPSANSSVINSEIGKVQSEKKQKVLDQKLTKTYFSNTAKKLENLYLDAYQKATTQTEKSVWGNKLKALSKFKEEL